MAKYVIASCLKVIIIYKCDITVHFLYSFRQEKTAHSLKDANLLFGLP